MIHPARSLSLRLLLLSTVVVLTHAPPAAADEPDALTEAEFVERFKTADPQLAGGKAQIDMSRAEIARVTRLDNPSVGYDREEVFPSEGDGLADQFVRLSLPVDLSGERSLAIDAARIGVDATRHEVGAHAFQRLADAVELYYQAAYWRLRVDRLRANRDELAAAVQTIRTRSARGDAAGYDLDRLELELGSFDDLIADAEAELTAARGTLARLVGEPEGLFDAATDLDLPSPPGAVERLAASGSTQRGDYQAATLRGRQAEREAASASRSWVPDLVLTGGLKTADLGTETATGYVVGVSLDIPLFQRGQGDRARALAEQRHWQATATEIQRQIASGVRTAHAVLTRRIAQASDYRDRQIPRAEALLRAAQSAYREGERPIFELVDAHRAARDIRLRELELRWQARRAEVDLWRALGRRP